MVPQLLGGGDGGGEGVVRTLKPETRKLRPAGFVSETLKMRLRPRRYGSVAASSQLRSELTRSFFTMLAALVVPAGSSASILATTLLPISVR